MSVQSDSKSRTTLNWRVLLRFFLALIVLYGCYHFSIEAIDDGISRFMSMLAIVQPTIEPANAAVKFAPNDPEAHYTRALTLINLQRLNEGVSELQQATRLRPQHYYEWLDLGVTLDRLGDQTGAEAALRESVRLAPSFAQPRWQLGNVLFREQRYQEAFPEMRLAVKSNPKLFEGMLDLAWVAADGNLQVTESLVQSQGPRSDFEFARFLAVQGQWTDAARYIAKAGYARDEEERALLLQTIQRLILASKFSEAYVAWAATHPTERVADPIGQLINSDFNGAISRDNTGFGWQIPQVPNVSGSIDPSGPRASVKSLQLDFGGESDVNRLLLQQLVLVQPKTRYLLNVMARTESLVTGGPPVIVVLDASDPSRFLGQSAALSPPAGDWSTFKLDFSTGDNTSAVIIGLRRLACTQNPCPIFGRLWLGGFSLAKA